MLGSASYSLSYRCQRSVLRYANSVLGCSKTSLLCPSLKAVRRGSVIRAANSQVNDNTPGRGCNFAIALEGAMKCKEVAYIHAEGYPAAEMKHGPIALIDQFMPVVFIAPKADPTYPKIKSNIEEVPVNKQKGRPSKAYSAQSP